MERSQLAPAALIPFPASVSIEILQQQSAAREEDFSQKAVADCAKSIVTSKDVYQDKYSPQPDISALPKSVLHPSKKKDPKITFQ